MRRLFTVLTVILMVAGMLALPVVTRPIPATKPVTTPVRTIAVTATQGIGGVIAATPAHRTKPFSLVGASWQGALPAGDRIEVRTHHAGSWSDWTALSLPDGGPDAGSRDARAAADTSQRASEPLWVGSADGVQARVLPGSAGNSAPRALRLVLVDGSTAPADAATVASPPGQTAAAATGQPTIYTRAQWGADERLRSRNSGCATPDYGSTIKLGFIHHTDGANGYSSSQVPAIIRSIYAYHVESNGWCDIGYNFLVDRFGRIWEGRYGGIARPVIGAHTGGFNTNTFGVALIGTYTSSAPSAAMLASVEQLFAWKLGTYYRDPLGSTTTTAGSFSGSRYAAGSTVMFHVVSGHRDADLTTCPGNAAYSKLAAIRTGIVAVMGAGFVAPTESPASIRMLSGQTATLTAGVIGATTWTLTVADVTGTVIRTIAGTASRTSAIATSWDGNTDAGVPAAPGAYTLTLNGTAPSGASALPYVSKVTVTPPVTISGPASAPYDAPVTLTGVAAPGADVAVTLKSAADGATAATHDVTAGTAGNWKLAFTADNDYSWSALSQGYQTATHTTKVAPQIATGSSPGMLLVPAGTSQNIAGTGLPGTTVTLAGQPAVTVASDGTWTGLSVSPTKTTSVVVTDSRGQTSPPIIAYAVQSPTVTVPSTGYSKRSLTITGNAGNAPLTVQLSTKPSGASAYTLVATAHAKPTGTFNLATQLPAVTSSTTMSWQVAVSDGTRTYATRTGTITVLPEFTPTIKGPAAGYYTHSVTLTGTAVPGDTVTVWTRPLGTSTWRKLSTTTAAVDTSWRATYQLRADTSWRATSASGITGTGSTVVRPTLHLPTAATTGAMITGWGYALPGQQVAIYLRHHGTSAWHYLGAVSAASTGRWTGHWHAKYTMDVEVRSHGQTSSIATVRAA